MKLIFYILSGGFCVATYKFLNTGLQSIPVANVFIDTYMPKANATFVKVYLYGLRQCFTNNNEMNNNQIARTLNILESDVVNAWNYWESVGAVNLIRHESNTSSEFDVQFVDLTAAPVPKIKKTNFLTTKPNYSPQEIAIYMDQNEDIRYMYKFYEEKSGKTLSSTDINILYSFYDWLRLPVEVIIMLLEYCFSINKKNMRYIEKIAIDWVDKGIDNIEKAEQHLKKLEQKNSACFQVKKSLGLTDRILSDTESKYIDTWIGEKDYNIDLIKLAYDVTVLNTGKLAFPYLNSILSSWNERGIKTVEAAKTDMNQHKQNNKGKYNNKPSATKTPKISNNKFVNFKQKKYDFEEIERLALQKRLNNKNESGSQ